MIQKITFGVASCQNSFAPIRFDVSVLSIKNFCFIWYIYTSVVEWRKRNRELMWIRDTPGRQAREKAMYVNLLSTLLCLCITRCNSSFFVHRFVVTWYRLVSICIVGFCARIFALGSFGSNLTYSNFFLCILFASGALSRWLRGALFSLVRRISGG